MYDYLVDHAIKNVWCTPDQDLQAIVKPARITSDSGVFSDVQVLWRLIGLPVRGQRFHVYQIGQLHPLLMGLFPQQDQWMSLADVCGLQNLIVDVYANSGVQLPRCEIWYMVTADKDLILAVKEQKTIPINLPYDDIFLRVYSNAFFNSTRANTALDVVKVNGKRCLSNDDILALQNEMDYWAQQPGHVYAFINGYQVDHLDLISVKIGDVVEYVFDSSIKRVIDLPVGQLQSFDSTLDSKHKYLLHYPGTGDGTIDYEDDIDCFILNGDPKGRFKALYYHRNQPDAMRMVTHKDYAVPVPYVAGYATGQDQSWQVIENLTLRLHIRQSGYVRPLVNENNRIKELYKLDDLSIQKAFLGLDSVVENWRAEVLEAAAYTRIMGEKPKNINRALVTQAYGYNAISKLLCDTPSLTTLVSGNYQAQVPYGLQSGATAYEFDDTGKLLGYYYHPQGSVYDAHNYNVHLVEMIAGVPNTRVDEVYGDKVVIIDPTANYRMYLCPIVAGVPNNEWADVTGSGKYAIIGNQLTWLVDLTQWYPLLRSDKNFLAYSLDLPLDLGLLKFSLTCQQYRNNVLSNYVMQVPMGELDIFLNGRALIENVDYVVHFPEVVIFNKEYLINPATDTQHLDIRFTGFCQSDLTRVIPQEYGYVQYGQLSRNNRFDIRDDKVMHIVADGYLYAQSELKFAEADPAVLVPGALDGKPYLIRDIITPLRGLTDDNTYTLRAKSQIIDKAVSDYMTLKYPQPAVSTPPSTPELYQLVSPFCSKLLFDMLGGVLDDPRLKQHYSDADVMDICKPYEWLLQYDPTQDATAADPNFTVIHPHPMPYVMQISIYYYTFLTRVNKIYLGNKVALSHMLSLAPAT